MIISMPTTARPQRRYDHRLRSLVQRAGDVTIATTGRDVLRDRGRSAGRAEVTRGRRAPDPRRSKPIGVVRDLPVSRCGRVTMEC